MNLTLRVALTFTLLGSLLGLNAQSNEGPLPPGAKRVQVRNFSICFLYAPKVPELYFRDAKDDYTQLKINTTGFDYWNLIPVTDELPLFTKKETPEVRTVDPVTKKETVIPGTVTYQPTRKLSLPPGKESLRKLFYYASNGSFKEMDLIVSDEDFRPLQARVINLSDRPVMIRFGTEKSQVAPGQHYTKTVSSESLGKFEFQHAFERPDAPPYISPIKMLRFLKPTQRLWIIFGNLPRFDAETDQLTGLEPEAIRAYEDVSRFPAIPKAQIVYPKR